MNLEVKVTVKYKSNELYMFECWYYLFDRFKGNFCRLFDRIAKYARGNGREGDGIYFVFICQF